MDELIKRLREWPRVCVQYDGSIDQLHDDAADAIEELQKRVPKVPHGRLGDLDEVEAEIREKTNEQFCVNIVHAAPTIIPADEGE